MNNTNETGVSIVNYGIEPKMKKCKGTGEILPITEFSFDKRNNRYETYSKKYKSLLTKKRRESNDVNKLKQDIYNLRHMLKLAKEEIKTLKSAQ